MTAETVWQRPNPSAVYREEVRVFHEDGEEDIEFKVTRRSLTFTEESRIVAKVVDPRTKRPDIIELLAHTVDLCVKENNFGLTADIVRRELPSRAGLAWFLTSWLCEDTMTHITQEGQDRLRKKSGP